MDVMKTHKRLHGTALQYVWLFFGSTNYLIRNRALRNEQKIQDQLDTLQEQIKQLRLEGKALQPKMVEKKCATMAALKEFARVDCLQLCGAVYKTFPREVRDIIYIHIHPYSERTIEGKHEYNGWADACFVSIGYFETESEPHFRLGAETECSQHLWKAEAVGENMLHEMIEQYYRSSAFQFNGRFDLIPLFQTTDQWNIGFVPADFITNVQVSISCDSLEFNAPHIKKSRIRRSGSPDAWGMFDDSIYRCQCSGRGSSTPLYFEGTVANLQTLFGFRQGTNISILFSVDTQDIELYDGVAFLREQVIPAVFATLQRLQRSGYRLKTKFVVARLPLGKRDLDFVVDGSTPTIDSWKAEFKKVSLETLGKLRREADQYSWRRSSRRKGRSKLLSWRR
jgi:hypothetical protein